MLASQWYDEAVKKGYFGKDKHTNKNKVDHSFWAFAQFMDEFYDVDIARKTPWVKMQLWFRKLKYDAKKRFKKLKQKWIKKKSKTN